MMGERKAGRERMAGRERRERRRTTGLGVVSSLARSQSSSTQTTFHIGEHFHIKIGHHVSKLFLSLLLLFIEDD